MKELLCLALTCAFLFVGSLSLNVSTTSQGTENVTTIPTTTIPTTSSHLTTTTPTPPPPSTPPPEKGKFIFQTCLELDADMLISGKSISENVSSSNYSIDGYCSPKHSNLTIFWKGKNNSITFHFSNLNGTVYLEDVDIKLSNESDKKHFHQELSADKTFYTCQEMVLQLKDYNVTLGGLKVQAFHYNSTFSGNGEMCGAKTTVSPATSTTPTTHSPSTPKPTPSLATDNYVINGSVNGTNVSCLVMKAAIKFSIPYEGKTKNHTYTRNIGSSPSYQGNCSNITNTLQISTGPVTLEFMFERADKKYSLQQLKLIANTKYFKDGKNMTIVSNYTNTKTFQLKLGDSYSCKSQTTLHLSSNVDVFITNLNLEAFRKSNTTVIDGKMVICPADQKTNSIVPIAVGAALAGLVVVVLIAYLIGRKRSRRGYESV